MKKEHMREEIMKAATAEFYKKGLKFTLQDIAASMHIAKKTIYVYFSDKEDLMISLIDYGFAAIHADKAAVAESDLPLAEKIRKIMIAMPDEYKVLDFRLFSELQRKMPAVYKVLMKHLETDWEPVLALLEEGIASGVIRSSVDIRILRMMITSSFETFLSTDQLKEYGIGYQDALNSMMDIIMSGIETQKEV